MYLNPQAKTVLDIIKTRRSIRTYKDQKVSREIIDTCIEAARLAPSAENSQPWRFIIIDDIEQKKSFLDKALPHVFRATKWAYHAPVIAVLCAKLDVVANRLGKSFTGIPYYLIDTGIAGEHFCLQAHAMELGTCWIGWFSAKGVKKALNLPKSHRPVALITLGYPAKTLSPVHKRKPIEEIRSYSTNDSIS